MSQVTHGSSEDTPQDNKYWRSVGQLENTQEYRKFLYREFQENASVLEDPISRRTFIKLIGASAALAGLSGCTIRKQEQLIQPYAKSPEDVIPGESNYYATAYPLGEDVTGLLVESFEGRPTKIEGNPSHSQSLGAAKAFQQASVLELYDPDRLQKPLLNGKDVSVEAAKAWIEANAQFVDSQGQGLAILTETQVSPTFYRVLELLRTKLPQAKVYRYSPLGRDSIYQGIYSVTGQWLSPSFDFEKANVVVGFGMDILGNASGSVAYTKAFSKRRDPQHPKGLNRLYAFESNVTVTGSKADHRIRVKHTQIEPVLWALTKALVDKGVISSAALLGATGLIEAGAKLNKSSVSKEIEAIADDLSKNKGTSLLVGGASQSSTVNALIFLINSALGNIGQTVLLRDLNFSKDPIVKKSSVKSIEELSQSLDKNEVKTLVILGGDPVYNAPANLKFAEKIAKAKNSVHLTLFSNQTTQKTTLAIPRQHYLEYWGDAQALDGSTSIVQPLIQPLYDAKQDAELLSDLMGESTDAHTLVQSTWKTSDAQWKRWLHEGVISGPTATKSAATKESGFLAALKEKLPRVSSYKISDIELTFQSSYSLYDGRFANNGWLQELPDPITKLTWDNAALLSQKTADKLHIKYGDMLTLTAESTELSVAALIVPGHAHDSVSISMGYGQAEIGRVGHHTGFNAFSLRTSKSMGVIPMITIKNTGKQYPLATTQEHGAIDGELNGSTQGTRHLVREATEKSYEKHPNFAQEGGPEHPPLVSSWPEKKYDTGYQWGLSIDLSKCTGCNACVTACQSENNIPIVGKKQVLNGREMHWIRIDRYFEGPIEDARAVMQPMTCLQCELAPCEQVCPVAATTHTEEGLNDMTYNRCVGTRYCSNNCPTKVRRFNFFDYHQRNPQAVAKERNHLFDYMKEPDKTVQLQFNPDVTIRMRGMMEKCTYCVQRINRVKITAKNDGDRLVKDGEIKTACQQTCPAEAIVFGNILDKNSEIAKAKALPRNYNILEEWNLKPRTSYLAGIRNPHPLLVMAKSVGA